MTELETLQRAKMYMDQLAQGVDPISQQELPYDSALNNIRLARCFFYVSGVLEQVIRNGGQVGSVHKAEFAITPEQLSRVQPSPYPIRITEFVALSKIQKVVVPQGFLGFTNSFYHSKI